MTPRDPSGSLDQINEFLAELFATHGVATQLAGEWVHFPESDYRLRGHVAQVWVHDAEQVVQLDLRLEIAPGREVIESFGGIGPDRAAAVSDALDNFTRTTFYVLLAAFFGIADEHTVEDAWVIDGSSRRVTMPHFWIRGDMPIEEPRAFAWFPRFQHLVETRPIEPGVHWARFYFAQHKGRPIGLEIVFDNEPWEEACLELADFPWPMFEAYYSVRLFLVIQDL